MAACIRRFLKTHHLPFLATDRNVLNLPAIGKSMTFNMVGITPEGKRILRFDHDSTRRHSPIIDRLGQIYIVENKSIASYLRQLQAMGEDAEEYATIWNTSKKPKRCPDPKLSGRRTVRKQPSRNRRTP